MERKKVALGMTKNAVVKKLTPPKTPFKNFTVAPKNVQIPAYSENTSMTLYSNVNKAVSFHKDNRGRCIRCRERSPVDMSTFKFLEDTTVVAVRAHLCDQTRVMTARTAIWNREYAKRLGERAAGTVWQKPDEVTAQMTGFCSATVCRCIDIANLSIVPRCADRIGVSKNELASLKTSFGNEKFLGQTMRTPHVLSQYYAVKAQSSATDSVPSSSDGPPPLLRMGRAPSNQDKNEEEERKILRPPGLKQQTPKMAVIPVMKNKAELKKSITTPAATGPKKRGRPRKVKSTEVVAQPSSRCLRSHKRDSASILVDNEVQETIRSLINEVCELVSIETS
uniref:Histone domain-containing protein n=3 Tax=Caenorhabditis tropicalis TaxID=1561998 RepID=A0A1I7TIW1_9PELO